MTNTLSYSELQSICESKKILIKDLLNAIGLTYMGLKSGLERQSIGAKYVAAICEMLQITPNDFYHVHTDALVQHNNIEQTGIMNMQQVEIGMDTLRQQLAEKDKQIDKLLNILNK